MLLLIVQTMNILVAAISMILLAGTSIISATISLIMMELIHTRDSLKLQEECIVSSAVVTNFDGKLRAFKGWYYSDFVEVVPGESFYYAFWGAQSASLCAYDANMNYIQPLVYGIGEHIGEILVENPKIKYVRGCTNNNSYFVIRALKPYISAQNYVVGSQSIYLQGQDQRMEGFLKIGSRQITTPWLKLEESFALPSNGIYLGRIGDDVVISTYGVIKKIN